MPDARDPSPTRRGGLLSRLRKPFDSSSRNTSDFSVQLDDEHRHHGPGDRVTGNVVLKVVRPIDITHIVVCLHGFAQVYKSPNTPGPEYRKYNAARVAGRTNKATGYIDEGFTSLLEDEQVLCGDGRLVEGAYQFGFELRFPRKHLPSSIDFERGTVTYMITSTLTRPSRTSIINPVLTCERRLKFVDDIDVARYNTPIIKEINLPIETRPRRPQAMRKFAKSTNALDSTSSMSISRTPTIPQDPSSSEPPKSPVRSEHSSDTRPSSENSRSVADSTAQSSITNVTALTSPSPSVNDKEKRQFTGSITIPRSGFIRGDVVEIKVNIRLSKLVKSLHGLIVTLFRQTRVDTYSNMRPREAEGVARRLPPIFRADVRSLSNRGDYHLFRKDLAQAFAPIIINPETMRAEARASLRVPDDAFPTIANVPGAIIGFRYMIEVLVDMKGKLARLERFLPPPTTVSVQGPGGGDAPAGAHASMYGMHPINTDDIRAQTAVYHERVDVVVGTRDSSRTSKWKQAGGGAASTPKGKAPATGADEDAPGAPEEPAVAHCAHCHQPTTTSSSSSCTPTPVPRRRTSPSSSSGGERAHDPAPDYTPRHAPPPRPDEEAMSEKERVRLAEARLLPSAPPGDDDDDGDDGEAGRTGEDVEDAGPSAPHPSILVPLHRQQSEGATMVLPAIPSIRFAERSRPRLADHDDDPGGDHADDEADANVARAVNGEDKMERERRRLLSRRSAPGEDDGGEGQAGPSAPAPTDMGREDRAVDDEEEHAFGFRAAEAESGLPKYERLG